MREPPGSPTLFVYYRIGAGVFDAALVALRRAQDLAVAAASGALDASLARRPEVVDGAVTLLETYRGPALDDASFAARLERTMDAASAPWRDGARHVERFELL